MKNCLLATLTALLSMPALGGDFTIKEYEIGLPIESYQFSYLCKPSAAGLISCFDPAPSLTVGGEKIKKAWINFDAEEKIDMMIFSFYSDGFDHIKAAIVGKYKSVQCTKSFVQNGFGAKFTNETCVAATKNETLTFDKYSDYANEGSLTLVSNHKLSKIDKRKAEKAKDI